MIKEKQKPTNVTITNTNNIITTTAGTNTTTINIREEIIFKSHNFQGDEIKT